MPHRARVAASASIYPASRSAPHPLSSAIVFQPSAPFFQPSSPQLAGFNSWTRTFNLPRVYQDVAYRFRCSVQAFVSLLSISRALALLLQSTRVSARREDEEERAPSHQSRCVHPTDPGWLCSSERRHQGNGNRNLLDEATACVWTNSSWAFLR